MSRNWKNVLNFVASQVLWLAAVGGAANGMWWLGLLVLLVFAAWQLSPAARVPGDFRLMGVAVATGLVLDTCMAASGLARYASPLPFEWMAPAWILVLWAGFALSFNHSMEYVTRRPWLAVLFGAIAGPFSYWVAARAWGAVEFAAPTWPALLALGLLWGLAMPWLAWASRHPAVTGSVAINQRESLT